MTTAIHIIAVLSVVLAVAQVILLALLIRGGLRMRRAAEADDEAPLSAEESWRKIELAAERPCDPDACCALSGLRAAGKKIKLEKVGSTRVIFVHEKE